ncbi:hypothetical protein E1A91_A04G046000v1, partial [Gossypium mustelinum]
NLQSRADETLSDVGTLEEEYQLNKRCLNWCPNWSWRYQLSKKAMKKTQDISELLDKFGRLGPVGYRAPTALPTIDFLCSKEFVVPKSSVTTFYQIMDALKDEDINMIGLWGMGGVGKTTLAHDVGSQAEKLNLFDKVVISTNEQRIRSEQELWSRLKNEQRILIILGIPIGDDHKGCKVLLTTRCQQVCQAIDCRQVVQLDCLDDDEAWTLFNMKAGLDDFTDDSIKILANQIVKKCGGLPIAIVLLGSALKGKSYHEWQVAYRSLEGRRLTEIEDVNERNAYKCLEASFDYLKHKETKTCFLLCSLFPEDYEIYVEDLERYASCVFFLTLDCGERHVKMHDVVRQFAFWIASSRKEISFGTVETLLMDESFKHYTTISFETNQMDELPKGVVFPNLEFLLLLGFQTQLPTLNLRTLCLIGCQLSDISMLGKLKTLHILSLRRSYITELPTEAGDLENLRLLDLSYYDDLQRIAPNLIQRFSNLEELYLHGCSSLKWETENTTQRESYSSLSELDLLPKLVVISLDISDEVDGFVCRRLWSFDFCIGIERNTWFHKRETYPISRSLRIVKSVDACKQLFEDVESLQLNGVEGHPNLIPSLDLGFRKLTSLDLYECGSMQCLIDASNQQVPITAFSNLRKLSLRNMFDLVEMCSAPQPQGFLQKLEEVIVSDCGEMQVLFPTAELRSIEQEGPSRHLSLQSLKIVEIERCNNLKYIFPMSVDNSLMQLHTLKIKSCRSLEVIIQYSQVPYISLQSLREIEVENCDNLKYLFPLSVANSLGQLHILKIKSCSQLEDIIQDPQVAYICLLQSLREVSLIGLPQLKRRDVNGIILAQLSLQKLEVYNCPQLTHLITSTKIKELVFGKMTNEQLSNLHSCKYEELEQDQTSSQHHPLPICFPNLILIHILECESLKSLFPITVAQGSSKKLNAPNLQTLNIERCFGMEEIIQDSQVSTISFQCLREVQVTECNKLKFLFPMCVANSLGKLQTLKIERCFGMEEIIQHSQGSTVSFQCLRKVQVKECDKLIFLFPMCVANSLGKLQTLKIKSCSQLQEIIQGPEVLISMAQGLIRLKEVELINLPQLKGRDRNHIVLTSPSLHVLKVLEFSEMTEMKQISNVTVPEREEEHQHLFEYSGYNLSSLEILRLYKLTELRVIWSGPIQVKYFQDLTQLVVHSCRRLRYIFSPTIARNLSQLWILDISDCEELEQIIEKDQTPSQHHLQPICFPYLSLITIRKCENLKCLFSITLAYGGLPNLDQLDLLRLSKLEQVFEGDESNVSKDQEKVIHLPRLTDLVLRNLPNLVSFSPVGYHFVFPSLTDLQVKGCPNITTRFSVDSEKSVHAKTQASQSVDEIIVEEFATA